tara:strand:- start:1552 stop:1932 length:381 start_codon:yes stop_codon:yes gene_type:complete
MSNSIISVCKAYQIALTIFAVAITASASAKELKLPDGGWNGAGISCPASSVARKLVTGNKEWTMGTSDRLGFPTKKGAEWKMLCVHSNGTSGTSTTCSDDGYIIAGTESDDMYVSCYRGKLPQRFK